MSSFDILEIRQKRINLEQVSHQIKIKGKKKTAALSGTAVEKGEVHYGT